MYCYYTTFIPLTLDIVRIISIQFFIERGLPADWKERETEGEIVEEEVKTRTGRAACSHPPPHPPIHLDKSSHMGSISLLPPATIYSV